MSNIRDSVSSAIQAPQSNFVENSPLRVVLPTLFLVFRYPDETLSLVFEILRQEKRSGKKTVAYTATTLGDKILTHSLKTSVPSNSLNNYLLYNFICCLTFAC